jgi:hypothetical protein
VRTADAWRKGLLVWYEGPAVFASIVFTWQLPTVRKMARLYADRTITVGGPAVEAMPDYFADAPNVVKGAPLPGVLQRFNPLATRTSTGCKYDCSFCSVRQREGELKELADWPDLPVIVDNNLLACSLPHFDKVIDRLKKHPDVDFNQGVDCRHITEYTAKRLAEVPRAIIRLALDNAKRKPAWEAAFELLRTAGISKSRIRSYAVIADTSVLNYTSTPDEAWERCLWIEEHGVKPLPMWFHETHALTHNVVTELQQDMGWDDYERRRIMQWFYQHKKAVA